MTVKLGWSLAEEFWAKRQFGSLTIVKSLNDKALNVKFEESEERES